MPVHLALSAQKLLHIVGEDFLICQITVHDFLEYHPAVVGLFLLVPLPPGLLYAGLNLNFEIVDHLLKVSGVFG